MSKVLEDLFRECFWSSHNTRLVGGAREPLYLPANDGCLYHRIYYREDYFSSALHEVAHWCIAGAQRRAREDYGYWYAPDGRDEKQQRAFERVEAKPQALEWHFARACGAEFSVSADNLNGAGASQEFEQEVRTQARAWCHAGLPERGRQFMGRLARFHRRAPDAVEQDFQ